MASDLSEDFIEPEGDSVRITLGFAEEVHSYTPVLDKTVIVALADEFGVSHDRILAALKRLWFEMVTDQLKVFDRRVGELRYDADTATHFAQRFL